MSGRLMADVFIEVFAVALCKMQNVEQGKCGNNEIQIYFEDNKK